MKIKNFFLPESLIARLAAEAKTKNVSEAELVRRLLHAALPKTSIEYNGNDGPRAMQIRFRGEDYTLTALAKLLGTSAAYLSVYQKKGRVVDAIKRFRNVPRPVLSAAEIDTLVDAINAAYRQKLLED